MTTQELNLVMAVQRGERDALEKLFRAFADRAYPFAVLAAGKPELAAGAVRWAFAHLRSHPEDLGAPVRFPETLCRLILQGLQIALPPSDAASKPLPEVEVPPDLLDAPEAADAALSCLMTQSAGRRAAVAAMAILGLSQEEAALALCCTEAQLASMVNHSMLAITYDLAVGPPLYHLGYGQPLQKLGEAAGRVYRLTVEQQDRIFQAVRATSKPPARYPSPLLWAAGGLVAVLAVLLLCMTPTPVRGWLPEGLQQRLPLLFAAREAAPTPTPDVPSASPADAPEAQATPTALPVAPGEDVVLSLIGDCTLGDDYGVSRFADVVGDDYAYPFAKVRDILAQDDLTLANLEGPLTLQTEAYEKQFRFKGKPEYAQMLVEGSIEAVTVANNHMRDYGQAGVQDTVDALRAHNIAYCGRNTTAVVEAGGLKIGLFGYSFPYENPDFAGAVQQLRQEGAQFIVFTMHWGVERSYEPTAEQIQLAHAAIDAGADLIVGHHPHVLQPIERYKGKTILYSLGNFCFGGNSHPSDMDTAIVQVRIASDGVQSVVAYPCSISGNSESNNYQPVPLVNSTDRIARIYGLLGVDEQGRLP